MPRDRDPRKEKPEFSDDFIFSRLIGPKWHGYKSEGTRAGDQNNAPSNGNVAESGLSLGRFEGHHGSTQEGKGDGAWVAYFKTAGKLDLLKFEADPDKGTVDAYLIDGELDVSGIYSKADLLEGYGLKAPQGLQEDVTFVTAEAYAVREGDPTLHGDTLPEGLWGSHNVMIGGKAAWRMLADLHICSMHTAGVPHTGGIVATVSDSSVLINGLPAVRVGDVIVENGPPNTVIKGEPTVTLGKPGPAVVSVEPVETPDPTGLAKYLDADVAVMLGRTKLHARVGGGRKEDGSFVAGAQAGGKVSVIEGEATGSWKIPIGDDWAITLGVIGEGSLLTAGASAGGGVSWGKKGADGKRRWGVDDWGASVGAVLFGGGAKISIGVQETS